MMPPPATSLITVTTLNGFPLVTIPSKHRGNRRYFAAIFFILWFIGWGVGVSNAWQTIMAGEGGIGLIIWFIAWIAAGYLLATKFMQTVVNPAPERLLLNRPQLSVKFGASSGRMRSAKTIGNKRKRGKALKRVDFSSAHLKTLRIEDVGQRQRLTITKDSQQVELGRGLSKVELTWLSALLTEFYQPVPSDG